MIKDISEGKWKGIVKGICVRDQKRFSRQRATKAGLDKEKLNEAGCHKLHSRTEGIIDWLTMTGQITDSVNQTLANKDAKECAENGLNGRIRATLRGTNNGQPIPYGYYKEVTKQNGSNEIIKRGEHCRRPKNWTGKLVFGDETQQAATRSYLKWH